mmetsp:Transcript_1228/g.2263  ORF Transcript_1228/g.2263 Transcript_1228/m.2263 type:complete len:84 (-) Transcript_1228:2-253(-)
MRLKGFCTRSDGAAIVEYSVCQRLHTHAKRAAGHVGSPGAAPISAKDIIIAIIPFGTSDIGSSSGSGSDIGRFFWRNDHKSER